MKKTIKYILAMVLLIGVTGCNSQTNINDNGLNDERGENVEYITMTADEKEILKSVYADENRIEKGKLYSYQESFLEQYRYAKENLAKKYPSYSFEIINAEPSSKMIPYTEIEFEERDDSDNTLYTIQVTQEENDSLEAKDNFYGKVIRENYDSYLYDLCQSEVDLTACVYSTITVVEGDEYNENMTLQEIIEGTKAISPRTEIFMVGDNLTQEEWNNKFALIEAMVLRQDLPGWYKVWGTDANNITFNTGNFEDWKNYKNGNNDSMYSYVFTNYH